MADVERSSEAKWYVAHTYSGYENKVKVDIEKTIENRKLQDQIFEVKVPLQDVVELKNGVKKSVSKKLFPGYVLINMIMNDQTWYVVRNTRGVTGFVGPGSKPVPLTETEMRNLGINVLNGAKAPKVEINVNKGDTVKVVSGAWRERSAPLPTSTKVSRPLHLRLISLDVLHLLRSVLWMLLKWIEKDHSEGGRKTKPEIKEFCKQSGRVYPV